MIPCRKGGAPDGSLVEHLDTQGLGNIGVDGNGELRRSAGRWKIGTVGDDQVSRLAGGLVRRGMQGSEGTGGDEGRRVADIGRCWRNAVIRMALMLLRR